MIDAAARGCGSCKIIAAVSSMYGGISQPHGNGEVKLSDAHFPRFRLGIEMPSSDTCQSGEARELFIAPGKGYSHNFQCRALTDTYCTRDTSSDACLEIARNWLSLCEATHSSCKTSHESAKPLPALLMRVIDVTPLSEDGSVRLIETGGTKSLYMCLSHCWGTAHSPVITTEATLEDRKTQIPWGLLPRTFQDAIDFVRRLGQRYI
ncbi:hypothetical protein P154DRAFT_188443 [Amniculicola lignicola CBS 123094]|uniref:Heterokaryon incompatibility domain-containing protein n=1 Tax=Amniculicola lignicola CBS 123094 TaxID=1392246 RepID=A0A6A5WT97_9PLEO|nr:hypothetical protein P154DRAFT_188443 [Amniculicola lignicola CBS 123094]